MDHMRWGFNGHSFQMDTVVAVEIVKLNTTEIWELRDNMMMVHAIHRTAVCSSKCWSAAIARATVM